MSDGSESGDGTDADANGGTEGENRNRDQNQDQDQDLATLLERAEGDVLSFLRAAILDESVEDAEAALDDLEQVVIEAEELLETIDLETLPEAINLEELPEAIDVEKLPEAVASGDPAEAIDSSELLDLVELGEIWSSVNVREFWRNKEEFEAALEEVLGEDVGEDADDGGSRLARLQSSFSDAMDDAGEGMMDGDDDDNGLATLPEDTSPEAFQAAIQSGLRDAIDEFRVGLIETHRRLKRLREENEERTERTKQPDSRNPTAYSTLASAPSGPSAGRGTRYSTVPLETRYSTAPNRERIYGNRFENTDSREEKDDE